MTQVTAQANPTFPQELKLKSLNCLQTDWKYLIEVVQDTT
jgi:hypothetical protein